MDEMSSAYAIIPLVCLALGVLAGLLVARYWGLWPFLWLLAVAAAAALVVIVRLAAVPPGAEEAAFGPLIVLTGGLFPGLFGAIAGGVGGRAWARRSGR